MFRPNPQKLLDLEWKCKLGLQLIHIQYRLLRSSRKATKWTWLKFWWKVQYFRLKYKFLIRFYGLKCYV